MDQKWLAEMVDKYSKLYSSPVTPEEAADLAKMFMIFEAVKTYPPLRRRARLLIKCLKRPMADIWEEKELTRLGIPFKSISERAAMRRNSGTK